ncbi:MAG: TldD/PmbA family protein [Tissierellia bacterium]|nr:TldD/PmbA family protein [Tissierellia bacterium]
MKESLSKYLKKAKKPLRKIVEELSKEFSYVSILGSDTRGRAYQVSKTTTDIRDSGQVERGFVLRLYNGYGYSEYSFDKIDEEVIIAKAKEIAKADVEYLKSKGLDFIEYPLIEEEEIEESFSSEFKVHMEASGPEGIVKRLKNIVKSLFKEYKKLVDFTAVYEWTLVNKIFISNKKDLEQTYLFTTAFGIAVVSDGEKYMSEYQAYTGLAGLETLDKLEKNHEKIVKSAIELLDAKKIKPGVYDFITDPDVSGLIAHEAFGHGVEMDMFVKNRAKAKEYIGKRVASDCTIMRDGAKSVKEASSYLFDDEGNLGCDTLVIENGILKTGYVDQLSALQLGIEPTGNGKRESFERKAYTRMTNTFFEPGEASLEDMIKSIDEGYLLEGYQSGMEDPKNWGIQCVVAKGREIKKGKLTGKIVAPVVLTGYVPDLLESISMLSNDLQMNSAGGCGKGYKEWSKVSMGGPYMKVRGRLG